MYNVAVVGAGYWGPNHIRVFSQLPNSTVKYVVDTNEAQVEKLKKQFRDIDFSTTFEQVLMDIDVDAVVICTPTSTHYSLVRRALCLGKHVLCEKPLCITEVEAQQLKAVAKASKSLLMVGHVFLFNAGIIALKEIVDSGELGDLQYMYATRTNLGPIRQDVNVIYDLATHDISIFDWILGSTPIAWDGQCVQAITSKNEDVIFAQLRYRKVSAHIHASWLDPKKVRQITIVGTKKMVVWDDMNLSTPIAIYDKGVATEYGSFGEFLKVTTWDGDIRMPKISAQEPLKVQDSEFLRYIEIGKVEKSDVDFSIGVVRSAEALTEHVRI